VSIPALMVLLVKAQVVFLNVISVHMVTLQLANVRHVMKNVNHALEKELINAIHVCLAMF